jgi:hypothetical protein
MLKILFVTQNLFAINQKKNFHWISDIKQDKILKNIFSKIHPLKPIMSYKDIRYVKDSQSLDFHKNYQF